MAATTLRTAAICAMLVILLSSAGQPAMAYVDGLACPGASTTCRTRCMSACDTVAPKMCKLLCGLTPPVLGGVDQACVNHFFTSCMAACKTTCEAPVPVQSP